MYATGGFASAQPGFNLGYVQMEGQAPKPLINPAALARGNRNRAKRQPSEWPLETQNGVNHNMVRRCS